MTLTLLCDLEDRSWFSMWPHCM